MASQQILIAETIAGMKRVLKRKAYESDSESSVEETTNRGNKLKKGARFVHRGHLAATAGSLAYKETIEHAGYYRSIISRNPPLIDEEGYEIDSDDDDERVQEAMAVAAESNPYGRTRIEQILGPLTSVTDLAAHPTLSRPYTSRALTELAEHGGDLMHKENASLWKVKHLLTRLCGDHTWVPCEMLEGPDDIALYSADVALPLQDPVAVAGLLEGVASETVNGEEGEESGAQDTSNNADAVQAVDDADATMTTDVDGAQQNGQPHKEAEPKVKVEPEDAPDDKEGGGRENGAVAPNGLSGDMEVDGETATSQPDAAAAGKAMVVAEVAPSPPASASAATAQQPPPPPAPLIHPFFLAPAASRPDRDLWLPEVEAEEVRRLLQLYVQKQEEICRGARRLHLGLLRADRQRRTVLKWAKAEAHVGPLRDLSDGEDWYDREEWGLDEDLKKGQDEEEEDQAAQTAKKTRNRRGG